MYIVPFQDSLHFGHRFRNVCEIIKFLRKVEKTVFVQLNKFGGFKKYITKKKTFLSSILKKLTTYIMSLAGGILFFYFVVYCNISVSIALKILILRFKITVKFREASKNVCFAPKVME